MIKELLDLFAKGSNIETSKVLNITDHVITRK